MKLEKKEEKKKEKKEEKKDKKWLIVLGSSALILIVVAYYRFSTLAEKHLAKQPSAEARVAQIYPNYTFADGEDKIRVPLIPDNQQLSREAGGWVITPTGSAYRNDYEIPITIEYIDGRKFYREPNKPAWDGVIPANSIFRLYGKESEYATVTIKRGVY